MRVLPFLILPAVLLLAACPEERSSAAKSESAAVERQQSHLLKAQPVPAFDHSLERAVLIQLYEARNQRVATHSVWRSAMGTVEDHCPSIGYAIPADTSLTNPVKGEWTQYSGVAGITIEQPEPNGLYSSKNTYGTWVRCVEEIDGVALELPIYTESNVTTYPYPVEVDFDNNRVKRVHGARPSLTIDQNGSSAGAAKKPAAAPLGN